MPRMRGRLYSSCASSTWSLPSALTRVLGEDVEDQLRAVDDARLQRVLEQPLLRGSSSSSTSSTSASGLLVRAASAPRACPCRRTCARSGCARCWTSAADRLDARGARELVDLGELVRRRRRPCGSTARTNPRSSAPGAGSGWRGVTSVIMPARAESPRGPRSRARTLALVDMPSPSREEAALAEYVRGARAARAASTTTARRCSTRSAERQAARAARGPHRHRPGAGRTSPAGSRTAGSTGSGRRDMKGGLAVMIELARWAAERRARLDLGCSSSRARSSRAEHSPLPGLFATPGWSTRRRS